MYFVKQRKTRESSGRSGAKNALHSSVPVSRGNSESESESNVRVTSNITYRVTQKIIMELTIRKSALFRLTRVLCSSEHFLLPTTISLKPRSVETDTAVHNQPWLGYLTRAQFWLGKQIYRIYYTTCTLLERHWNMSIISFCLSEDRFVSFAGHMSWVVWTDESL